MRPVRKCILSACLLVVVFLILPPRGHAQGNNPAGIHKVVIDPGHGGKDPGALGGSSREKDIVLKVALKVGNLIRENLPVVEVLYTRKTDVFIELEKRAEIANKAKADVFISIHANSIARSRNQVRGAETYVLGVDKANANMEIAQRENSVILLEEGYNTRYEGFDPHSSESYIMFSLMQNVYLNQSLDLAQQVQQLFKTSTALPDKGVKQAGFLVLARTTMPGILVEIGYLSNPSDEKYLMSENGQEKIAQAIFGAFREYKKSVEGRTMLTPESSPGTRSIVQSSIQGSAPEATVPLSMNADPSPSLPEDTWLYVQIMASKVPVPSNAPDFKKTKGIITITESDYYRYGIIKTRDLSEARKKLNEIRTLFPNAFITATSGGKIIPVQQALNQIKH